MTLLGFKVFVVDVHPGFGEEEVCEHMESAIAYAKEHPADTVVLFADELNTSPAQAGRVAD